MTTYLMLYEDEGYVTYEHFPEWRGLRCFGEPFAMLAKLTLEV
jgi:hypothetical protein